MRTSTGYYASTMPKGMDMREVTQIELNWIARKLNERPRKTLNWASPNKVWNAMLTGKTFDQAVALAYLLARKSINTRTPSSTAHRSPIDAPSRGVAYLNFAFFLSAGWLFHTPAIDFSLALSPKIGKPYISEIMRNSV